MIRIVLDRLYLFAGYAAGGFMVLIFILMMVLSAGRPMGVNLSTGDDFVAWCMAAMAFLGLAHTFRSGEMIRVGLLIDPTQQPFVLRRLGLARVAQTPNLEWIPSESLDVVQLRDLYTEEIERRDGLDLVVMAGRRRSDTALRDQLRDAALEVPTIVVGDALAPRTLLDAVAEGARAGATI